MCGLLQTTIPEPRGQPISSNFRVRFQTQRSALTGDLNFYLIRLLTRRCRMYCTARDFVQNVFKKLGASLSQVSPGMHAPLQLFHSPTRCQKIDDTERLRELFHSHIVLQVLYFAYPT